MIDVTLAGKIGNLTKGAGLVGAFDGNAETVAYAEYASGYIGVSFLSPKRVDHVEVVSASNGFDASGLATGITLLLYGKVGGVPSHGTDGVVLATTSFTDQNLTRTVTLESTDKITTYDHVWIRVLTGVWCIVSDIRFYEAEDPSTLPDPEFLSVGMHLLLSSCNDSVPLSHGGSEIPQFRILIPLSEPRQVALDFHGCVVHTGVGVDADIAVGYSFRICHRSAASLATLAITPFTEHPNAANGGNVINRNPQHYGNASITDAIDLPTGFSEISMIGSGHTDGSQTQGLLRMLVEGGKGLNNLRVIVLP